MTNGLFGFWLRFGSVTGFYKPAPSPKPRQNPKILAPNGYSFSSNALGPVNTNAQSFGDQRQDNKAGEKHVELVKAAKNPAITLEPAKEPFNFVSATISDAV